MRTIEKAKADLEQASDEMMRAGKVLEQARAAARSATENYQSRQVAYIAAKAVLEALEEDSDVTLGDEGRDSDHLPAGRD